MDKEELQRELEKVKTLYNIAVKQRNAYRIERFGEAINYIEKQMEKIDNE